MSLLVMKFGGTSVGSADCIRQSAEIVCAAAREHSVAVVVSALSGITDRIMQTATAASAGDREVMHTQLAFIEERHREVIGGLLEGEWRSLAAERVGQVLAELREFCTALLMLRAATPQVLDVALSMGERMSAPIFSAYLCSRGLDSRAFDSAEFLITDENFGEAAPDMPVTAQRAQESLLPILRQGGVPVITGYRGATPAGQPTTLGRGGSDYSATILGAALNADEIWIWTDVDGVMSADPRICPGAMTLPEVSFAEAIEMSYYGAKVIHHKATRPAMNRGIPVLIKNSFRPESDGTRIVAAARRNGHAVKAVTAVTEAVLITLNMRHTSHFQDLFGRLFLRLGHDAIDVLFSTHSSSENALGLVFRRQDAQRALRAIERVFRMEIKHKVMAPVSIDDVAVIAVLGEGMKGTCGILGRLFSTVARCQVSVIAVAQGASEINICFAIPAGSAPVVVRAVHDEFFAEAAAAAVPAGAEGQR